VSATRKTSGEKEPKARKGPRHERLVIPDALPERPDENSFAFARSGELPKHLSIGQLVLIIEEQPKYVRNVLVKCADAEAEDA